MHPDDERNYPPKRWVWLTQLIQKHGWTRGVEVGVKDGENLFYLLDQNPNLHMIGVDPYIQQPGKVEDYRDWDMSAMYARVWHKSFLFEGRCSILRMKSTDAAPIMNDTFDFVFIDAMHDYESLMADIKAWRPLCRYMIAGHDHWPKFPGVEKAVRESFRPDQIVLGPNTCWSVFL